MLLRAWLREKPDCESQTRMRNLPAMIDGLHRFSVQCTTCGTQQQQTSSKMVLRDKLKTGTEITNYCVTCNRSWPADHATRALLARQLGVKDWR